MMIVSHHPAIIKAQERPYLPGSIFLRNSKRIKLFNSEKLNESGNYVIIVKYLKSELSQLNSNSRDLLMISKAG
jgi:hypothetical protein